MKTLQNKKIVLGLSGGIAAYKAPELVRRLKDQGADVRVVMTQSAKAFVSALSLQAVSANPVADSLLDPAAELAMGHIELAKWADLILIAPATANTIAKLTHGLADDLLTTICLATDVPIAIAPAMNQQMWHNKITQANVALLKKYEFLFFGPGAGEQACGDVGLGRMLDIPELVELTCEFFQQHSNLALAGQHWVITAGPTREAIDPVRYISNHSSGKMGYAIAEAAANMGAKVTVISGPVNILPPKQCDVVNVDSAESMHKQALNLAEKANVFIACAAVADYRVATIAEHKLKKTDDNDQLTIQLIKNPDIVADVAKLAKKPFVVGFAAETQDVEKYALGKLNKKNLDLICANNVAIAGQGFNSENNTITIYSKNDKIALPLLSKKEIATNLVKEIINFRQKN